MRTRRLLGLLALLLAAVPSTQAQAVPACPPGIGIGLIEFPAGNRDPRANSYVIDHVTPGTSFSRAVQVCNGTAGRVQLSLYVAAAAVRNGTFSLGAGRAVNELTGWSRVEPASIALAPGARGQARAFFDGPASATAGERYAVVVAEAPSTSQSTRIPIASRVGVRVYLDVGPGGAPTSDFAVDSLQAQRTQAGALQVSAQVHNTGRRAVDISGELALRDGPGGLAGGPYPARLGTTLGRGETEPVLIPIADGLSGGPWTARLTLRSGELKRTVEAVLTFPSVPGGQAPRVDVEQVGAQQGTEISRRRLLPLLLVPLAGLGAALARRRRR